MAGGSSTMVLVILFVAMNSASLLVHAISCQDAIARMLPCQGFLMGVGQISVPCCQSAQSLSQIANTNPQERTSVCQCLKQAATIIGINVARAQQIPQLCHIDLATGSIDLNADCSKLDAPTPQSSRLWTLESGYSHQSKPDKIGGPIVAPPPPRFPWDPIVVPSPPHSPHNEGEKLKPNKIGVPIIVYPPPPRFPGDPIVVPSPPHSPQKIVAPPPHRFPWDPIVVPSPPHSPHKIVAPPPHRFPWDPIVVPSPPHSPHKIVAPPPPRFPWDPIVVPSPPHSP